MSGMQDGNKIGANQFPVPKAFTSDGQFNSYCKNITTLGAIGPSAGRDFDLYRAKISTAKANPDTAPKAVIFSPPWGGVVVTQHVHPAVEKFLVIDAGKWLAYEWHAEKVETLEVREGFGLLIYTPDPKNLENIETYELIPGVKITLQPEQRHCIIAINDLLVFESSLDPKGMDLDLNFQHTPVYW